MLRKYLRAREAAEQLGISRRQLFRLAAEGILPSVRLGRRRTVFPADRLQNVMDRLERETRRRTGANV